MELGVERFSETYCKSFHLLQSRRFTREEVRGEERESLAEQQQQKKNQPCSSGQGRINQAEDRLD